MIHHGLLLGEDGKKLSKRHGHASVADFRDEGIPAAALRAYLDELGLPRTTFTSTGRASAGSRSTPSTAMPRRGARRGRGRASERRPRAARRAHARRGARDRPTDPRPAPVALREEARPTLERFVELRDRAPEHARRSGCPRDRPRAEGRRRRPQVAPARVDRRAERARALDRRRRAAAGRGARRVRGRRRAETDRR